MNAWTKILLIVTGVLLTAAPAAWADDPALDPYVMFGFNRWNGHLYRYDFADSHLCDLGDVTINGTEIDRINGAAYFPGYQNIFAFWTDTSVSKVKFLYVNTLNAEASVVNSEMEGGAITGATAAPSGLNGAWEVFAIQLSKISPPFTISGLINLNPNNSSQNEFVMTKEDGTQITRSDLHQNAPVGGNGVLFQGNATFIHVKPKGNGNQNGLLIDGEAYKLMNANTYEFSGNMVVTLYNDNIHSNGKAMGKWWIAISAGTASFAEDVQVGTPNRLAKIDHLTGDVIEIMPVSREYQGLATTDGLTFYASYADKLYRIDATAMTETLVATMTKRDLLGLEFNDPTHATPTLFGFEIVNDTLIPVNATTGAVGTPRSLGVYELGTIVFTPADQVPEWSTLGCD